MTTKKPKLTTKQAKFVKGIAEGKTNTQSALEAYDTDSEKVASVIAAENLGKPSIQEAVENARIALGITPELAVKPVADALNSDDLEMRLKGHDRAMKLMGARRDKDATTINNFGQMLINKEKYDD